MSKKLLMEIVSSDSELAALFPAEEFKNVLGLLDQKFDKLNSSLPLTPKISKTASVRSAIYSILLRNRIASSTAISVAEKIVEKYENALKKDEKIRIIGAPDPIPVKPKTIVPVKYVPSNKPSLSAPMEKRVKLYQSLMDRINEFERRASEEQYTGKIILPGENDVDTIEMAKYFATNALLPVPDICRAIGVTYDYDVQHTTLWFAAQVGTSTVAYEHRTQNRSARRTYNHYRNPPALLWIATVMGESIDTLCLAAGAMKGTWDSSKSINSNYTSQCGAIRKIIPFDRIMELWRARPDRTELIAQAISSSAIAASASVHLPRRI